jgi:dolichol-phosphate mannosyltransferase
MESLTIVLPTYNEAENLPDMVQALWALGLPQLRLIVVDDSSPDGTGDVADVLAGDSRGTLQVIHRPAKSGLGTAYLAGFRRALDEGATLVGQMDVDFSHAPADVLRLLAEMHENDIAVGSRYVPGGKLDSRWGAGRRLLSWWGNLYSQGLLALHVHDATAGFKVWRRETLLGMDLRRIRSNGYVFQVEMAYVAQRLGYRVCEVPIYFEDRRIGQSKMSTQVKLEAAWRVFDVWRTHHQLTPADRLPLLPA